MPQTIWDILRDHKYPCFPGFHVMIVDFLLTSKPRQPSSLASIPKGWFLHTSAPSLSKNFSFATSKQTPSNFIQHSDGRCLWWCGEFRHLNLLQKELDAPHLKTTSALLKHAWLTLPWSQLAALIQGPVVWGTCSSQGELRVVRDRFGRIPVSYASSQGTFAISSIPSLPSRALGLPLSPRRDTISVMLYGTHSTSTLDLFEHTHRLRPHEALHLTPQGQLTTSSTWTPSTSPVPQPLESLTQRYIDQLHQETNHTSGALMLSGGLDSSSLAFLGKDTITHAVSMVFPGMKATDESLTIQRLTAALPFEAHHVDMTSTWALRDPSILGADTAFGPVFHPGNSYELEFMTSSLKSLPKGTRLISGLGADELFTYPLVPFLRHLAITPKHAPLLEQIWPLLTLATQKGLTRFRRLFKLIPPSLLMLERTRRGSQTSPPSSTFDPRRWLIPQARDRTLHANLVQQQLMESGEIGAWRLDLLRDWSWELLMRSCRRQERILGRPMIYPYLSKSLWELCFQMPIEHHWGRVNHHLLSKFLARLAAQQIPSFPSTLAFVPKSISFSNPVDLGLALGEVSLTRGLAKTPQLAALGLVNPEPLQTLLEHYITTVQRTWPSPHRLASSPLWRTLAVEDWLSRI